MVEDLASNSLEKVSSGLFNLQRPVPEGCGDFVSYRIYQQDGTVLGNTTDLEFAHTGLTNGTEYCYYVSAVYDVDGVETVSESSNISCGTPEEWIAEAPANLMTFPGDEEVLLIWQGPGGGGGGDGTEGDNMDNPFVVTALPFSVEGTTVGFEDDYDEVCPYSNSASADVVYMMTSSGATYDFSLCTNTAYDSKIYILDIDGNTVNFSDYKGKKVLIVNVASKCGYTSQYKDLQELYNKYNDKITILAFPSNNFGFQEPGSNNQIEEFCETNFGIKFQLFEKSDVRGKNSNQVYKWLSSIEDNGWNDKSPRWNFFKYLVDEN